MRKPNPPLSYWPAIAWFILSLPGVTSGQALPSEPPANTPQPRSTPKSKGVVPELTDKDSAVEDAILLSPFEVSSERDIGYQATETLAGTRIRTDLKDVGSALTVVTKQFMEDIGATDNMGLLQYTLGTEVGGVRSSFLGAGAGQQLSESTTAPNSVTRVRGLGAADNSRSFFVSDIPWDSYNVGRVDIQRGPNSILFGLGKPAGTINAGLNDAEFRNRTQVQNRFDEWGTLRTSLDMNVQVIPKVLALRFDALRDRQAYRQEEAWNNTDRYYGALRFEPALFSKVVQTTIRANYEHGNNKSDNPRVLTPIDTVTPFFKAKGSSSNWGGNGGGVYDPWLATINSGVADDRGVNSSSTDPDWNPWISNLQGNNTTYYLADGSRGVTSAWSNLLPQGVLANNGTVSQGVPSGFVTSSPAAFLGFATPQTVATALGLPLAGSGQYKVWGLSDPTIFDFYNHLIDGSNNKWEGMRWDAYNIDFAQTALKDRVGWNLTYDHQKFWSAKESVINSPQLNVDLTANFLDGTPNPDVGRIMIKSLLTAGENESKRDSGRFSFYAELRASDFLAKGFWTKLLGHHRFNGVYALEDYSTFSRSYNMVAASPEYQQYAFPLTYATRAFGDGPAIWTHVGPSLIGRTSASGLNVSPMTADLYPRDMNPRNFATIWNAPASVLPGASWNRAGDPFWGQAKYARTGTFTQSQNPNNYVGWNSAVPLGLITPDQGQEALDFLTTGASKALRRTESLAGSTQSFWWNDALVTTIGWRYDVVKTKNVAGWKPASTVVPDLHGHVWMSDSEPPASYKQLDPNAHAFVLPGDFDPGLTSKGHAFSWGGVLHTNRLFKKDPLPLNVSLTFNKSSNFEVAGRRVNVFGTPLANPTGETKDWGVRLSTKDGKYSFRWVQYESASAGAGTSDGGLQPQSIAGEIAAMLKARNLYAYSLSTSTYDWANRFPQDATQYTLQPLAGQTAEQAAQIQAAGIAALNEFQSKVDARFYASWGFRPNDPTKDPVSNPDQQKLIYNYAIVQTLNGFTITEDTASKGSEFELTANPTRSLRLSVNASRARAKTTSLGDPETVGLIDLINHYLFDTAAGQMRLGGSPTSTGLKENFAAFNGRWSQRIMGLNNYVPELREWHFSSTANYTFLNGRLKGLGMGTSYRWEDKSAIGYAITTATRTDGSVIYVNDRSKPAYAPAQDYVDVFFSYGRKITKRVDWKIQVNVRNLFGKDHLIPVSVQPDGVTFAQYRVAPTPHEWAVTNTFTF